MNEFVDYCFCSTWDGDGEICNRSNKIVWRFQTTGLRQPSVFSFRDGEGKELVSIRREKWLPMAQFATLVNDVRSGTVAQRTIWRTKYELEFESNLKWSLEMPLFSISCKAIGTNGEQILFGVQTRRQWFARMKTGLEHPALMAALAFVVRKRLQDK
jgi:hypothetical protein